MTAANRDAVYLEYQTLAHLDFTTNEVRAFGHWAITGGTGHARRVRLRDHRRAGQPAPAV